MSRSIRSRLLLVAVCAGTIALAASFAAAAETNKDAKEFDGTWKLVSVEQEGEEMERDDDVRLVIQAGEVFYAGEPLAAMVIYAASTPGGLDLSFREPKNTYEGIFVLEKNELKCCFNTTTTGPKDRPSDFATRNKPNLRVLKFERAAAGEPGTAASYVGMMLSVENETIVIQDVLENSPGKKAGLQPGDVLVSLGGQAVSRNLQAAVDSVRRQTPGSDLAIRVVRDGKEKEVTVRVAVFPFSFLGILG